MKLRFTNLFGHAGYLLLLLTSGGLRPALAQNKPVTDAQVTNIRLTAVNQTSLEILYDLAVSAPGDSVYFDVTGRRSGLLSINPGFVEGDFGRHVRAGSNRRIIWNVLANGYELNEEIRVRVLVRSGLPTTVPRDSTSVLPLADAVPAHRPYRPGGPATALLSVLMPGLGNIFVQGPKPKVGLRPLLAVGVATALVYGFNQRSGATKQYAMYAQQKNPTEGEPYFQQANQQHHRYYLATRAAAALWLGDVVATLIQGLRNRAGRRAPSPVRVRPAYQGTTPVAALTLRF